MCKFYKYCCVLLILVSFFTSLRSYASNNPAYTARQQAYIDTALVRGGQNALSVWAYSGVAADSAILASTLASVPVTATSDFRIEILVRMLYLAPGVYDTTILPTLRRVNYWINDGDTLDCYWSENHMAQWMSSHWLLHERYGIPADTNLRTRLVHFLQMKVNYNYYEFFSTTYNPFCLSGLLNLADFSQDTVVKNLATQASQLLMKDMLIIMNDQGVLFPTAGRNYPASYENPYGQDISSLLWLITGRGQMPGGPSHSGCFLATSSIAIDSVAQSWVPTLDTTFIMGSQTLQQDYAYNSSLDSVDRVVFQWSAGAYFNPEFALQSYNLLTDSNLWRNVVFQPIGQLRTIPANSIQSVAQALYTSGSSQQLYSDTIAVFKHNSVTLSSVQDYWPGYWGYQQYPCVANVANTSVYTASGIADSIWDNRSHNNENDDLPYVKQVKNVALEMYRPLPKSTIVTQSNPTVSLHWRNADYTEVRNDSLWLLGRVNNNYVGVRRSCVGKINGVWACEKTPGSSWVIIVGDSLMYGSFNNFQTIIDSSRFTERWYYDSVAHQSDYFAQIIINGDTIDHVWAIDSITTGIQIVKPNGTGLNVYPNPANTTLNISLDNNPVNGTIEVYNVIGEMIYQSTITGKTMSIPISEWGEGMYAVRVSSDSGTLSKCFLVSH